MAAVIRPDDIDFGMYMRQTNPQAKVRAASAFMDSLKAKFEDKRGERKPHMFSTKLRQAIEFRPGEVTCWAGYNGHKKSMFTGQVALDLLVQKQRTLMASFEMDCADTIARMACQAFGVERPAPTSLERFAKWTDGRLWMFDHVGRIGVDECLATCNYFAAKLDGAHVFLDSMMMICASEEKLDEQKQFTTDIVRLAQETGLHIHVIAHCRKPATGDEGKPPSKYDIRGSAAISDQAHNVITVWSNKAKVAALEKNPYDGDAQAQPDAAVTIEKQRNGKTEGRFKLWFHEQSMRFMDDRTSPVEPYVMEAA
jgi:twinkle protein